MNEAINKIDELIVKYDENEKRDKEDYEKTVLEPLNSIQQDLMRLYSTNPSKRLKQTIERNGDILFDYYSNYESFLDI